MHKVWVIDVSYDGDRRGYLTADGQVACLDNRPRRLFASLPEAESAAEELRRAGYTSVRVRPKPQLA